MHRADNVVRSAHAHLGRPAARRDDILQPYADPADQPAPKPWVQPRPQQQPQSHRQHGWLRDYPPMWVAQAPSDGKHANGQPAAGHHGRHSDNHVGNLNGAHVGNLNGAHNGNLNGAHVGNLNGSRRGDGHTDSHERWNSSTRGETPLQRLDRIYAELLQEVRVAQTGVQILLAFLLSVAFTPRFVDLTTLQRNLYVLTLGISAAAAALLIAPGPLHRLMFQRKMKRQFVKAANQFAIAGFALLMLGMSAALTLALYVVLGSIVAPLLAVPTLIFFVLCWYAYPMYLRSKHRRESLVNEKA